MSIKKLLVLSAAGLAAVASAAALAGGPDAMSGPAPAAPAPVVSDWTGIYAGANIGGAIGNAPTSVVVGGLDTTAGDNAYNTINNNNFNVSSAILGAQLGYNYEFQDFVFGLETNFDYMNQSTSNTRGQDISATDFDVLSATNSVSTDWTYTLRGRLGYSFNDDTMLVYGTGGLALADLTYTSTTTSDAIVHYPTGSLGQTMVGWTAGGGLEWKFVPNWSVQGQYLYENLGTISQAGASAAAVDELPDTIAQYASLRENVVTAAINYHF